MDKIVGWSTSTRGKMSTVYASEVCLPGMNCAAIAQSQKSEAAVARNAENVRRIERVAAPDSKLVIQVSRSVGLCPSAAGANAPIHIIAAHTNNNSSHADRFMWNARLINEFPVTPGAPRAISVVVLHQAYFQLINPRALKHPMVRCQHYVARSQHNCGELRTDRRSTDRRVGDVEQPVDDHACNRDVEPQRKCPARDCAMPNEAFPQRARERDQNQRNDHDCQTWYA